ncbi:MAG: Maf family protein [Armatimonadota bacterium]
MLIPQWPVVLASASPRRAELLKWFIEEFTIDPPEIDEDALLDADPNVTAQRIAREKVHAVYPRHEDSLVISGDTVVALADGGTWTQLGKPKDKEDAVRMLMALSGRTHTVVTGVCLRWPRGFSAFSDTTEVTFKKITKAEAEKYVATGGPLDKAGSYGLQDESQDFVAEIRGSMTNVIGLPMERLDEVLNDAIRAH